MIYDEVIKYSKIDITREEFNDSNLKKNISKKLKLCNWNKSGTRFHFNNYVFLQKIFHVKLYKDNNKYFIILDEEIKISIKQQEYFHINFVLNLYEYEYFNKKWFDVNGYVNNNFINIENNIITYSFKKKIYRVDTLIKLYKNYYLAFEFFEKKNNNLDDDDLRREQNRFLNMYNNQDESKKIAMIIVFWDIHIDNQNYIDKIIKKIYKLISYYKNIDNERKWCINIIDQEVIHSKKLSKQIYDGFIDNNKPLITFDAINTIIQWKNDKCREQCFSDFMLFIDRLKNFMNNYIDNNEGFEFYKNDNKNNINCAKKEVYYENNKLSYNGLFQYIPCIKEKYLSSIEIKYRINQLMKNITNGFILGIKQRYNNLSKLSNNKIYGLNNF